MYEKLSFFVLSSQCVWRHKGEKKSEEETANVEVRSQEGETHGAEETSGEAGKTRDEKREKAVGVTLGSEWNVGSYQHNVDTNSLLLSREFRGFGGRNTAPEYTPGPFGSGGGTDEIEMELPEGTDGLTGFQTRRKIKTRANGCEGESFTIPLLSLLPPLSLLSNYTSTEQRVYWFRSSIWKVSVREVEMIRF